MLQAIEGACAKRPTMESSDAGQKLNDSVNCSDKKLNQDCILDSVILESQEGSSRVFETYDDSVYQSVNQLKDKPLDRIQKV